MSTSPIRRTSGRATSSLNGRGFCIGKAALLAAATRAIGVPARVGYADVRNHLTSRRLYERIKTDIFIWHSYADLHVCGRWVKATPAFDLALCERVGIKPLEFDGENDSLFHPFDREGRRHMEYLRDRGTFADVPFETIQEAFSHAYPSLMTGTVLRGDFRSEAVAAVADEASACLRALKALIRDLCLPRARVALTCHQSHPRVLERVPATGFGKCRSGLCEAWRDGREDTA